MAERININNFKNNLIHNFDNRILYNRRQITPDTSIRLGRFFGVANGHLLRIQNDINFRNLELKYNNDYKQIKKYQKA